MCRRGAWGLVLLLVILLAGWTQSAVAAPYANLADISCAAPGECAAVGTAYVGSGAHAILYTQALGVWSRGVAGTLPADAGSDAFSYLFSVSCPSAGTCVAAGEYTTSAGGGQGLLISESNGVWGAGAAAPLPGNAAPASRQSVQLGAVTCLSAGNCTAVGEYMDASGSGQALMLTETGGTWGVGVEAALPGDATSRAGRQFARLSSVSCPAPGNCTAVGEYTDTGGHPRGLLLTETGGTWSGGVPARLPADAGATALLNPSAHFNYGLNEVSCPVVGECTVVGEYANRTGLEQGLLLNEHRGTWSRGRQPRLPSNAATARLKKSFVLWSGSCPSAGNCAVVGWYETRSGRGDPLVVTERNGRWARGLGVGVPPNAARKPPLADELEWVSCASAGNCTAVGDYYARGKLQGLLITESHGRWGRPVAASLPGNGTQAASAVSDEDPALYRVSCAGAGSCSALGTYEVAANNPQGMLLTQTTGAWGQAVQALL
ncbi:MAG: hypothetical protein ACXVVK_20860 [Solirubrobacteraceae bacterium]